MMLGAGDRRFWAALAVIGAIGLGLRIAAAQGDLWLDEAWSALLARDAGTPLGIFLHINHDNNHHLNSLWMQAVGIGAPPLLARAFAIAGGAAAVLVAGAIGARHSAATGLATALLFAVSPLMVTLGSEARGYAPMALALLVAILLLDRALDGTARRSPATALALCFFLGALSQLTIVFGFCAIAGWVVLTLWQREGLIKGARAALRLLLPSLLALVAVGALVAGAAAAGQGFQFGRYDPFEWGAYLGALTDLVGYATGLSGTGLWWLALPVLLIVLAARAGVRRLPLYILAILAFPLALALLQAGNTGFARYYLVAGVALLLLLGELVGIAFASGAVPRALAAAALAALMLASLWGDARLIANRRGDPGAAIRALAERAPGGALVLLGGPPGRATIEAAAAHARYPLHIVEADCPPARFLFADQGHSGPARAPVIACNATFAPIASGRAQGLSGTDWTLYERLP